MLEGNYVYFAGGELYDKVSNKEQSRLEEDEAKTYFAQIIDAVQHLVRDICTIYSVCILILLSVLIGNSHEEL